jgi:Purple acid Phosphatase, N-terminal domain
MKRLVLAWLVAVAGISLGTAGRSLAVDRPANAKPAKEQITTGPELERATDIWAIIRWTTNNVKGTALRYGVVLYGTDPHRLGEKAFSPNRWNPGLPYMIYRVQVNHLAPATTYYYRVGSENALRVTEGPQSPVGKFTTQAAR